MVHKLERELREVGADFGPHLRSNDYPLDEATKLISGDMATSDLEIFRQAHNDYEAGREGEQSVDEYDLKESVLNEAPYVQVGDEKMFAPEFTDGYNPSVLDIVTKKLGFTSFDTKKVSQVDYDTLPDNIKQKINKKDNFKITTGFYISRHDYKEIYDNIRSIGGRFINIVPEEKAVYFYLDTLSIEQSIQSKIETTKDKLNTFNQNLDIVDISKYEPDEKVLNKLKDYRDRGSKVNVKAIGNDNKLLTYYYGAYLLGWSDLRQDIEDILLQGKTPEYKKELQDLLYKIQRDVRTRQDLSDTDNKQKRIFRTNFRKVNTFLYDNKVDFDIESRQPHGFEVEHGNRNGRSWSLPYTITIRNGNDTKQFEFSIDSNEGGGDYGYYLGYQLHLLTN